MWQATYSALHRRKPETVTPYQKAAQIWATHRARPRVQAETGGDGIDCFAVRRACSKPRLAVHPGYHITPWVVEVDSSRQAQAVATASPFYQQTRYAIAFHLARLSSEDVRGLLDPTPLCEGMSGSVPTTSNRIGELER